MPPLAHLDIPMPAWSYRKVRGVKTYRLVPAWPVWGGGYAQHATHACVPRNMAVPIPDGVSDEDASSIHLVATALNAVRRGAFQLSEHIAVAGLGLVGQFTCQWARISGCYVMGLDQLPMRLDMAATCGFFARGQYRRRRPG